MKGNEKITINPNEISKSKLSYFYLIFNFATLPLLMVYIMSTVGYIPKSFKEPIFMIILICIIGSSSLEMYIFKNQKKSYYLNIFFIITGIVLLAYTVIKYLY